MNTISAELPKAQEPTPAKSNPALSEASKEEKVKARVLPHKNEALINLLKSKKIRVIVIRHGESIHNLSHLMSSTRSPGVFLTEKGIEQVKQAALALKDEKIGVVYVSPVFRALQTAQQLNLELKLQHQKVIVEENLREQFFGDFEEHTYEEYEAYFKSEDDTLIEAAPNGESGCELFKRTSDLLERIAQNHSDETVLLVTHAYNACQVNKCLTGSFDDIPKQAEFKVYN